MSSRMEDRAGDAAGGSGEVSSKLAVSATIRRAAVSTDGHRRVATDRISLLYELLDAHIDTAELAADLEWDERWAAHLDYLRALQRTGRRALAEMSIADPDCHAPTSCVP
jgi:hypothetical protein